MSQVITFEAFQPSDRFDSIPWTAAEVYEGDTISGPWTLIDTIALTPVDTDPTHPAVRNLTTSAASETDGLWYQIVFVDASGNIGQPTTPIRNLASATTPYATVEELARILKIREPSIPQTLAMRRVLVTAAVEIDAEVDLATDASLSAMQRQLATEVNLERAVEHWRQEEAPFGLIGLGGELGGAFASKDSWERHAIKLAPCKSQWGLA